LPGGLNNLFPKGNLGPRFWWRKVARLLPILKTSGFVCSVAKWLICRVSTAAQANRRASSQPVDLALRVDNFKIAFDAKLPIITNNYFG
jgi:hypothetical protein